VFTKNLDWKTKHNLNAFNDLFCAEFGIFEYDELIDVWSSFSKSREILEPEMIDIIKEHIDFAIIE
jgi:hypothetical protein